MTLTKKEIIILTKKNHLMPVLYHMEKTANDLRKQGMKPCPIMKSLELLTAGETQLITILKSYEEFYMKNEL